MEPDKLKEAQVYIDFVKTNLEPLAEHLKVSVEWLWQILVNQVRVEAIVYLVVIILMSIKASVLLFIAFKSFKKARFTNTSYGSSSTLYIHRKTGETVDWDTWYDDKKSYDVVSPTNSTNLYGYLVYLCGIGGATLGIVTTIVAASVMPKIVTGLVNPEYGAIERIVQFTKGKIPSEESK